MLLLSGVSAGWGKIVLVNSAIGELFFVFDNIIKLLKSIEIDKIVDNKTRIKKVVLLYYELFISLI